MLVDYGSDSDSDQEVTPHQSSSAKPSPAAASKPTSSGLQLPAPKGKSKKDKGPVKIQLTDVSTSNASAEAEPARKRPKLGGAGGGGLASLLPAPKKDTAKPAAGFSGQPAVAAAVDIHQPEVPKTASDMMMPNSLKRKQPSSQAAVAEPADDMFRLSSQSASVLPSLPSTSASTSKKAFTAAPALKEQPKQNYYATLPAASPDNPYPGFHCIPQTGEWAPDQPKAWAQWAKMHGWSAQHSQQGSSAAGAADAPRGFEDAEVGGMSEISSAQQASDAAAERAAAADAPTKAAYVDPKEQEEKKLKLAKLQGAGRARGKNQLSSLLSNAISMREDLEERIATAKQNKQAGGKKYGF